MHGTPGRKSRKTFAEQCGAYAPAAILRRHRQIFDEVAGPALNKSGHAAVIGNGRKAEIAVEFGVLGQVAVPVLEGCDERGKAEVQHMMGIAGIYLREGGQPISLRPYGGRDGSSERFAQAQMGRLLVQFGAISR